mmetsp:Transcript_21005/g.46057  ORF Transcript_21005/g.46057 Transcript_21005/m.46057 type:complete len:218 (+) Transcript_21005:766-1419(+)
MSAVLQSFPVTPASSPSLVDLQHPRCGLPGRVCSHPQRQAAAAPPSHDDVLVTVRVQEERQVAQLTLLHLCQGLALLLEGDAEPARPQPDVHRVHVKAQLLPFHGVGPLEGQVGHWAKEHPVLKAVVSGVEFLAGCDWEVAPCTPLGPLGECLHILRGCCVDEAPALALGGDGGRPCVTWGDLCLFKVDYGIEHCGGWYRAWGFGRLPEGGDQSLLF